MSVLKWGKPSLFQKAPANTPATGDTYVKTTDTDVVSGKTYYTKSGDVYTPVTTPVKSAITTYYENNTWTNLDMPKEGTLQINTSDGQENTATEEGGDIVDMHYAKSTHEITWDEFDKRGGTHAFEDNEGIVEEETALRLLPEDPSLDGFYIPRAKVRVNTTYNVADGVIRKYTLKVLKPDTGKSLQPYSAVMA